MQERVHLQCSHYETPQHKTMEAPQNNAVREGSHEHRARNEAEVDKFCSCSDNHRLSWNILLEAVPNAVFFHSNPSPQGRKA